MNYFAHGAAHLDRPYIVAGTALPDWLSVTDRRARLQRAQLDDSELADGVRLHWRDDQRFHHTRAFLEVSGTITRDLRRAHADDPRLRAAFFGHILTEMLLDAVLIERDPARLDDYYAALDAVDADRIAADTQPWLSRPAPRLAATIARFRSSRYLYGYADNNAFHDRVGGVARRVGLGLPSELPAILPAARALVAERADDLL